MVKNLSRRDFLKLIGATSAGLALSACGKRNTNTPTTSSLGAVVLVNSNSAYFSDFKHYIQPYLDNFGVPYTIHNLATTAIESNIQDYALIIIAHRQIDVGTPCLDAPCLSLAEQAYITAAINSGVGLINFDDDLSANGSTNRYQFIQDIFKFGYMPPLSGSGVLFAPAAVLHYITARHPAGESISTGEMTLSGITLPSDGIALATTNNVPFLAVRNSGLGHAVQWGTYNWMSTSAKGPLYGLDDLVWRSMAWAARKPFVMQGTPPFLTLRVDDVNGPFDWIRVANEVGIKPWAGIFLNNIGDADAKDLSRLVNAGWATTSIHAFADKEYFFWHQNDTQIAKNYTIGAKWFQSYNIPISKYVVPHFYQLGLNAFGGLADWGVECVGTQQDPGKGYGATWVRNGPYRKYETGPSNGTLPVYYADYLTIPSHPEFNGRFFNLITEIRDDLGYEWYPSNDVASSISHGTLQATRALDSMALATLFTHDQSVSKIALDNWRAILQGITTNLAPYNPIFVTMDYACQYIKSKHNSTIVRSSYDSTSRQVTVNYKGTTEINTKFFLIMDDHGAIREMWIDVPRFKGQTQILFTLPDNLFS